MDETVLVEVDQSQGHVVKDIDLDMEGDSGPGGLLEVAGETLVAELHQEHEMSRARLSPCAQVLDDIGVLDGAQEAALLLKLFQWDVLGCCVRSVHDVQGGVDDFGGADCLVATSLAHGPVGARPQRLVLQ